MQLKKLLRLQQLQQMTKHLRMRRPTLLLMKQKMLGFQKHLQKTPRLLQLH
jgi:hypothetical protein